MAQIFIEKGLAKSQRSCTLKDTSDCDLDRPRVCTGFDVYNNIYCCAHYECTAPEYFGLSIVHRR